MWKWWLSLGILAAAVALVIADVVLRVRLWRRLPKLPAGVRGWLWRVWRYIRPAAVLVGGIVLVLGGLAMIPLPGPGSVLIFAGLALLATEFVWARVLLNKTQDTAKRVSSHAGFGKHLPPNAGPIRRGVFRFNHAVRRWLAGLGRTAFGKALRLDRVVPKDG